MKEKEKNKSAGGGEVGGEMVRRMIETIREKEKNKFAGTVGGEMVRKMLEAMRE